MNLATQFMKRWFFMYGFSKNERSNITRYELLYLQEMAIRLLHLTDDEIDIAVYENELKEAKNDEEK